MKISLLLFAFALLLFSCKRDECGGDNADSPVQPELRIILRDSATGHNLLAPPRRYQPDSVQVPDILRREWNDYWIDSSIDSLTAIIIHFRLPNGCGYSDPSTGVWQSWLIRLNADEVDTFSIVRPQQGIFRYVYNGVVVDSSSDSEQYLQIQVRK